MKEVYVLTHEYSDNSHFQICGITENGTVMLAWVQGGSENHAYKIPLDQIMPRHPNSEGWPEMKLR